MEQIKISELKKLVGVHYKTKIPLFIYGAFGIGKSSGIKQISQQIAKEKGKQFIEWNKADIETKKEIFNNPKGHFVLIDERLSQYEPSDIKGLPRFNGTGESLEWVIPMWLEFLTKKDADGILFFDEMNLSPPSVLASCYQIFHDREVNEKKISDDILIIGAGNRLIDKANTFDLPLPLRDRKSEVELVFNSDEWFDWALDNEINKDVISFLKFREDYTLKVDDERDIKPITPRGWERVSKLLSENENNERIKQITISGAIGGGVAREFLAFCKLQNSVDIENILLNPQIVRGINEVDLRYSLVAGLSKKFDKDSKILESLLFICKELPPEYSVLLLKFLVKSKPQYIQKHIGDFKIWVDDLSKEYGNYLI